LVSLLEDGLIEAVVRPLQSGKEAQIYLVVANGEHRVAKVYKQANDRTFKHRTDYVEGRGTRNTRDQRAMKRRSSYGRTKDEDSWRSTEVEMIYRLREAGVRVPAPHLFSDGVLIMELVQGHDGGPAPRIGDLHFTAEEAIAIHDALLRDVIRMLCAGVVHGDLSEFNVLMDGNGPVIIDLPQAVDASSNPNAKKLLVRDVENIQRFIQRWVPGQKRKPFAAEMWSLYEVNELSADTELTGTYKGPEGEVDTAGVLDMIDDAREDETQRRLGRGQKALPSRMRTGQVHVNEQSKPSRKNKSAATGRPKPQAKPKREPEAPPPSKALSKDELIAQAIAAAKEAAARPKPQPKPSGTSGRRRKRSGGSDPTHQDQPGRRRSRTTAGVPADKPRRSRPAKGAEPASDAPRRRRSGTGTDTPTDAPGRRRRPTRREDVAQREGDREKRAPREEGSTDTRRRRRRRPKRDDSSSKPTASKGREGESRERSRRRDSGDPPKKRGRRNEQADGDSGRGRQPAGPGEQRRRRDPKPTAGGGEQRGRSDKSDGSIPKRRRRRRGSGSPSGSGGGKPRRPSDS
jgi:RIO kinase 1